MIGGFNILILNILIKIDFSQTLLSKKALPQIAPASCPAHSGKRLSLQIAVTDKEPVATSTKIISRVVMIYPNFKLLNNQKV